jgi:hypothetical protein
MAKFLKITPPKGFATVVPDTPVVRSQYEKLNEVLRRNKESLYLIEDATDEEIRAFNPTYEAVKPVKPKNDAPKDAPKNDAPKDAPKNDAPKDAPKDVKGK